MTKVNKYTGVIAKGNYEDLSFINNYADVNRGTSNNNNKTIKKCLGRQWFNNKYSVVLTKNSDKTAKQKTNKKPRKNKRRKKEHISSKAEEQGMHEDDEARGASSKVLKTTRNV